MKLRNSEAGISLMELMIAAALIGIGVMGAVSSFGYISKSVQGSKARTVATNLAQEKIQIVMQKSYYEVLVTTLPAYETRVSPSIPYDPSYFPPETVLEGSVWFTRYTYIVPVTENSGVIQVLPPTSSDTGIRQVTISVIWKTSGGAGEWNSISMQNIVNNPNTVMSNSAVKGVIRNSVTGAVIPSALVDVAENVGWRDTSDSGGNYFIRLSPGNFDLIANAQGYYPKIVPLSMGANATLTQDFNLAPISSSTVRGTAWLNNHLVISQVVPTTGTAGAMEYVELYNPTTYAIFIGSNDVVNAPTVVPIVWDQNNSPPGTGLSALRHLYYAKSWVPAQSYYLISNSGSPTGTSTACNSFVVSGVAMVPDACWKLVQAPSHAFPQADAGGFSLGSLSSYVGNLNFLTGNWPAARIDSVGWSDTAAGRAAPSNAVEGTGLTTAAGVQPNEQFIRKTSTSSVNSSLGNAYDADINNTDFMDISAIAVPPRTSTYTAQIPIVGVPAVGAIVSVTDGLSAPSTATLTGSPPYAQYTIAGVSTGTWTVFLDSGASSAEIANVIVTTGGITSVPNATTSPPWASAGSYSVVLSTYGLIGTVSGLVTDLYGGVISPSIVVTINGNTKTVSPSGYYAMRLTTGTYNATANAGNANATYEAQTLNGINIALGDVTSNVNFRLSQGGRISGWVTRDGVNPLPGVSVIAMDANGIVNDTQVSATNGRFTLINLSTATYTVQVVLDPKETSTPLNATANVVAGTTVFSTTFTVIGAMGTVTGSVSASSDIIKTGVLIVVSTSTLSGGPPTLSSASLTAAAYYSDSSHEDGTYSIDVRGSTSTTYNVYAFYQRLNGQTPLISSGAITGVSVLPNATTSGKNFTW